MTGALKRPSGARCVAAQDENGSASEDASKKEEEEEASAQEVSAQEEEEASELAEHNAEGDEADFPTEPSPAEANSALTLANVSLISKMSLQDTCSAHDM